MYRKENILVIIIGGGVKKVNKKISYKTYPRTTHIHKKIKCVFCSVSTYLFYVSPKYSSIIVIK